MYIPSELAKITYDIYIRRSSDDEDHQVASLESQKGVLLKLVRENNLKLAVLLKNRCLLKSPEDLYLVTCSDV